MSLTLSVSVSDASMNCPFEVISVAESLVRQFGLLECFPCGLDGKPPPRTALPSSALISYCVLVDVYEDS